MRLLPALALLSLPFVSYAEDRYLIDWDKVGDETVDYLVDLVKQEQRITCTHLAQVLNDLTRQGTDIGSPMASDFSFYL